MDKQAIMWYDNLMFITDGFDDYKILDTGGGMKLEQWGGFVLARPDPQAIWEKQSPELWEQAHARYIRSREGGGSWEFYAVMPEKWVVRYRGLSFYVRPTGFKHTGLFPEQAVNWDYMAGVIENAGFSPNVLNLFGYTGGATAACAAAGARVTHIDAARSMNGWAKDNLALSGLSGRPVRILADDCMKFVKREQRRGNRYDAVVLDPPSYGRGADGKVFRRGGRPLRAGGRGRKAPVRYSAVFYNQLLYYGAVLRCYAQHTGDMPKRARRHGRGGRPLPSGGKPGGAVALRHDRAVGKAMNVLYEDNHIIVAVKPQNMPSQADSSGDADFLSMVKAYVKERYGKPGEAYIGLVHRLDRPAGGVMVFARTSKAAARLSRQISAREMEKDYFAVVGAGILPPIARLEDHLVKDRAANTSRAVPENEPGAKPAVLEYETVGTAGGASLLDISLYTGRPHQIRVQLSHAGAPIVGMRATAGIKTSGCACGRTICRYATPQKRKKWILLPPAGGMAVDSVRGRDKGYIK